MNIDLQILGLLLNVISYLFIFFLIFNLLKVNYFNPIVSTFVKVYKPLSKVFFIFPNQIINILLFAIIFKLLSLMVYFSNQYEILTLLGVANEPDVKKKIKKLINLLFYSFEEKVGETMLPNGTNVTLNINESSGSNSESL